ncbi:hypothetical protein [Mycolicibacterium austroafricanum]|uniref:Uncharacterized protein n=1 Tax=Mycolicibacterium austroafricanum TaxID=39687 RepID=A0ABT8HPD2_MYCAO|nr:hypothetical protein [Mycolicibacterium austroafricanum]MDN4522626.1 hypothetical protein [Mycolicibacterium austroafricanum]QRZ07013.1 hypothetical protein JN090_29960 [Mycolicibacterium austroafricanum]QZT68499.1 hypothetical protein JN086_29480 [Mycolicibacterium austroafricanum]QZY46220.1 hypothetical protein K5L12_29510 [Mycolicibacterium austroafricanum]
MTQTTELPALPDGVDILNQEPFCPDASGNSSYRIVWSLPAAVPDHMADLDIRLGATQLPDGSIVNDGTTEHEVPTIYVGGHSHPVADARALANALQDLADLADTWTGTTDVHAVMANAHRAVRAAYILLRTEPGNVGDYLRAALDSISDAEEVIR